MYLLKAKIDLFSSEWRCETDRMTIYFFIVLFNNNNNLIIQKTLDLFMFKLCFECVCVSAAVCLIMNDQHLKESTTTQIWTFWCRIPLKGFFFSPFFLFLPLSFTKTCLSCLHPSLCPTSPFLLPLQRAGAWALALNPDPACNQSYPWALPSSQATDSSSLVPSPLRTSSFCFLFVPVIFYFIASCWIQNGHADSLKGCRSETTKSKQLWWPNNGPKAPPCQSLPWPMALSISLWNDLKLMSKWWCQLVKTGQLGFRAHVRRANNPKFRPGSSQNSLLLSCSAVRYIQYVGHSILKKTKIKRELP